MKYIITQFKYSAANISFHRFLQLGNVSRLVEIQDLLIILQAYKQ